jgi:aspartyl-tRNA(Asn)/glutamyl-tRNA(Gln) amidotransferase subunit C
MSLDIKQTERIATLARLNLTEEEKTLFGSQLSSILVHIEKLSALDTSAVEPTSHAIELTNVFREDVVKPSLTVEQALSNAPDADAPFFRVPKILD